MELLAALAIIAVLVALGGAGWQRALASGREAACLANLRTIGAAAATYSAENDGRLPATSHQRDSWIGSLQPFLGSRKPYRCPADANARRVTSYAVNDCLTAAGPDGRDYSRRANIPRGSQTVFMAETADDFSGGDHFHFIDEESGAVNARAGLADIAIGRHHGAANYLFVDGHVARISADDLRRRLDDPASPLINPNP